MKVTSKIIPGAVTINHPLEGTSEGKKQAQTFGSGITLEVRLVEHFSSTSSENPVPTNHIQILDQMKIIR